MSVLNANAYDGDDVQEVLPEALAQSQSEVSQKDAFSTDHVVAELSINCGADPGEPKGLQSSVSEEGEFGVPVVRLAETNPPVRRSTRAGAGQHSNPYHLPRPVLREDMTAAAATPVTHPEILNSLAQSNLLIAQLLASNARL